MRPAPRRPAAAAGFPVTVTSLAGKVHLTVRPGAIISLSPTATEMLYAIGAGSQVKAVDERLRLPGRRAHHQAVRLQPNAEAIAAYKPDLVVISNNIAGHHGQAAPRCRCRCSTLPAAANLSQASTREFDQLGAADRAPGAGPGRRSARLKAAISKIVAAEPSTPAPLTYYYEVSTNPYYSVTSTDLHRQRAVAAGPEEHRRRGQGRGRGRRLPELSAEFILKSNPDYIILADTGATAGGQDAATVSRPARLVGADRRQGQAHHHAERRHRLALGTADRGPAADGGRGRQVQDPQ